MAAANKTVQKAVQKGTKAVSRAGQFAITNPVTVLYLVVGAIGIYTVYKAVTTIKNRIDPDLNDTVEGVGCNAGGGTISDQQAINFAKQLLDAMNYGRNTWFASGTDEAAIKAVFDQLKTPADFCKVFHVFGEKEYDGYESPPDNVLINITAYEKRNLVFWLKSELHPFWDKSLYQKVKAVVEQAGFAF